MNFLLSLLSIILPFAEGESEGGGDDNNPRVLLMILLIGGLVVVMFVIMPMLRKKKQSQYVNSLYSSIKVGCTVKTIGGVVGKVISVNEINPVDREVVIESGMGDTKSTLTFDMMYIYTILTNPDGTKYIPPSVAAKTAIATQSTSVSQDDSQQSIQSTPFDQEETQAESTIDSQVDSSDQT